MDLRSRSSRSRSTTPAFSQSEQEHSISQSIRITRSKVKNYEESSATILAPVRESMEKVVIKTKFATSDYSSDDGGENEVSSTLQNAKNQTIENTQRTRVNGEMSALHVYRQAGEYWNKYPKTDYTYSHHSKDRCEISPGVIQMPNMSRKSLRNTSRSPPQYISNKACSTDSYLETDVTNDSVYYRTVNNATNSANNAANTNSSVNSVNNSLNTSHHSQQLQQQQVLQPRKLFINNNNNVHHNAASSSSSSYSQMSSSSSVRSWLVSVYSFLAVWIYSLYEFQSGGVLWLGKKFYRCCSRVMLWDRWLLSAAGRSSQENNARKVALLCLVPLLLLGGWFLLSGLASYATQSNPEAVQKIIIMEDIPENHPSYNHHKSKIVSAPNAREIAHALTEEQLAIISRNIRDNLALNTNQQIELSSKIIIEKILEHPEIQTLLLAGKSDDSKKLLDILQNQQLLINNLREEISSIRMGLSNTDLTGIQSQLRKCCRNSFIATEKYVLDLVKELFNAPGDLEKKDFSQWLKTIFVAQRDLETQLSNLTANLHVDFDSLIAENGKLFMDEIAVKLREFSALNLQNANSNSEQLSSKDYSGDEHVKKIVRGILATYDADKTGLVDYALESSGGQVLSTKCTESYQSRTAVISILGIPLWYPTNTPRTVLTPGVHPGECWAFQNFPGYMVIQLSATVKIEAVSYEHISKKLSPTGKIDSAPKQFEVHGVHERYHNESVLLGEFSYDANGESLQFFAMNKSNDNVGYRVIELRVISNHGNPNYTCLYRLRVHGMLSEEVT